MKVGFMPDSEQPDLQAENAHNRQLRLLADITRQLVEPGTPQALLDEAARSLHRQFGFDLVCCLTVDAGQLVLRSMHGVLAAPLQLGDQIPLGTGLVGQAGLTGQKQLAEGEIALPLHADGNTLGVLDVQSQQPGAFSPFNICLLETVAASLAANLHARTLTLELGTRERLAKALERISATVNASLELNAILGTVCAEIKNALSVDGVGVWMLEDDAETLRLSVIHSLNARTRLGERLALSDPASIVARSARERRPIFLNNAQESADGSDRLERGADVRALLAAPIIKDEKLLGALSITDSHEANRFGEADVAAAIQFSNHVAVAIGNAHAFAKIQRRAAQFSLLYDVSQHASSSLDEAEILQRIMTALVDRFGFTEAALLAPVEKDFLEVVALANLEEMGVGLGFRQRIGEGVAGQAAKTGVTYLTNDISNDPFYFSPRSRKKGSALAVPILRASNLLGVLYIENARPGGFGPEDALAMETLSRHIATAMENARLYARANDRLREMTALQSLSRAVVSSLDLSQIFQTVAQLLHVAFNYKYVVVGMLEGETLHVGAQVGYPAAAPIAALPITAGIAGRAVRASQIQFVADVAADPDYVRAALDVESEVCIPLLKDQVVLGVLDVSSTTSRPLTETDADLLSLFAGQLAVAIENAQLYKESQRRAEEQQLLFNATRDFTAGLTEGEVLKAVASHLVNVIHVAECNILRWERAANRVISLLDYDGKEFVSNYAPSANEDLGNYPATAHVLESRQTLVVRADDPQGDPAERALMQQFGYHSLLLVPLFTGGQTFGVVELYRNVSQPVFSDTEIQLAQSLAAQAAVAMFNARLLAETRRQAEEQSILFQAIRDFTSALDEDAIFSAIARHMTDALGMISCAISRWNRGSNQYNTVLYHDATGRAGEGITGLFLLDDYPATRQVLETGQFLIVHADDPNADSAERAFLQKHNYKSVLLMPLMARDNVIGLVELYPLPGASPFSESALQLAHSLNAQAAIALDNARLHAHEKQHAHELNALLTANSALLVTLDLEPLLNNILAAAINTIPCAEKGSILLSDPATNRLQIRALIGYSDPRIKTLAFAGDDGYSAKAARERHPIIISDARGDASTRYDGDIPEVLGIHSAIVAPLIFQEALVGVIALDSTRRSAFTDSDLKLLEAFASTAAATVNHARAHAEAQNLADTDGHTGLANRRAFDRVLTLELNRAERYGYQLSLIVLDIDSFKSYNDTYGHPAGDERIKALADLLRANLRDTDLAARYGGEEFAIILPHTDKAGALALAERIRVAAEASAPEPYALNHPIPGYTISLGVAAFPADSHTPSGLLLAADNAELLSKRSGKNQVSAARALDLQT
ncbi:MAG: GAF domain-containing protein [Chloroflexi bacterium]|nr:GAF domain-containing protein [Chloroflexota bacterium]